MDTFDPLKQGHNGTQLRHKIDGELGKEVPNTKGVAQGGPLSAQLFTIYFGAMLNGYGNALPGEIKQTKHETYERNEFGERKMANRRWRKSNIDKQV